MRVSVVVAVYDQRQYLGECVDSILSQTHRDLDVVLVDDGSTDGSAEICDRYAQTDPRVRVLHQPNQGVSAARNNGAAHVRAQYMMYVDSDDTLPPRAIECLVVMLEQTGAKAAIGRISYSPITADPCDGAVTTLSPRQAIIKTLYQDEIDNSLCGKLLPTRAVLLAPQTVGIRFEDLDTFYRIYEHIDGPIAVTSAAVYYYRPHPHSFIHVYSPERLHVLDVTDRIVRHYADDPEVAAAARDRRFSANYDMFILSAQNGRHDVSERCWQVILDYRRDELRDGHVRLKNRVGALLSYLGPRLVLWLAKFRNKT